MSNKILNRVWFDRKVRRTRSRLILLALADMSNDLAICWPGQDHLKGRCAMSKPTLLKGLAELETTGQIEVYPRPGRQHYYVVRTGQPDDEYQQARKWLEGDMQREAREPDTGKPILTGKDGFTPPVKTGLHPGKDGFTPPVKTGLHDPKSNPNRTQTKPKLSPDGNPTETPHRQLMRLYQEALGYPIPNGAAEGKAAKEILKHYTPEQAIACYHKLKGQKFWAEMHLGLASVNKQLGAFVGSQDTAVAPLTDEEVERLNRELNGEQL